MPARTGFRALSRTQGQLNVRPRALESLLYITSDLGTATRDRFDLPTVEVRVIASCRCSVTASHGEIEDDTRRTAHVTQRGSLGVLGSAGVSRLWSVQAG